jgi:hypothetical protein
MQKRQQSRMDISYDAHPVLQVHWPKQLSQRENIPFSYGRSLHGHNSSITLRASLYAITRQRRKRMPNGTLDLMKLDGQPITYQIMFEQNAGGTFVARVDSDELVPFLHEEMRVELSTAESAAQRLGKEDRVRLQNIFLEENNLHAVMEYMEEDI